DPFVMSAWNKSDGSSDITMLADGNGAFADAVGLSMDASKFGMGKRSQRYSMLVNDGVVEQLNVEAPGEYRVSSAQTLLGQLQDAFDALIFLLTAGPKHGSVQRVENSTKTRRTIRMARNN